MPIRECITSKDIMATLPVMKQLRPDLDESRYEALIMSLKDTEKYRLVGLFNDTDNCLAVAGFRPVRLVVHSGETQLYIDDLVTDQIHRSKGSGKTLLAWLREESKRLGYKGGIALVSGTQRHGAHKFYFAEGMEITAFQFQRKHD